MFELLGIPPQALFGQLLLGRKPVPWPRAAGGEAVPEGGFGDIYEGRARHVPSVNQAAAPA